MTTEAPVIDCDGHILEPPDLWERYLEPGYRDRALRIRVGDDGFEYLEIDGRALHDRAPGPARHARWDGQARRRGAGAPRASDAR